MLSFTKGLQELLRQAPKNKGPAQRRPGLFNFNPAATYSPIRRPYSTIGAEGLNDRVRDGIGCYIFAIATGSSSAVINGRLLRYARSARFNVTALVRLHLRVVASFVSCAFLAADKPYSFTTEYGTS